MYLGLDLGRAQADYAATKDGLTFTTGTVTLAKFPTLIEKLKPSIMACEYTGRLAERWCLAAEAAQVRSLIMHSVDRRAYTVLIEQSVKTDKQDAQTIAKLLWIWEHPDARSLLPLKVHLFSEASTVRDAWQLRALFASVDRLTQLRTAAKLRVGIAGITGNANMVEIWQEFAQSDAAERAAASVITIAQEQFPREMELLISVPGIGPKTAAFLCASLLPIERFQQTSIRRGREYNDTYRNLRRYAGLYPKVEQSGKMSKAEYLSRRGSPALRGTLYMCCMSLVRTESTFSHFYERQKARLGNGKKALVLTAAKLLTVCAAVLLQNKPYFDPAAPVKATLPAHLTPQAEAARRAGVSRQRISQMVKEKTLASETWNGRQYVVSTALDALITNRIRKLNTS